MSEELVFPHGLELLKRWSAGEAEARARLGELCERAIAGDFDSDFSTPPPTDRIHVGGSVNLMTLNLMHDLFGLDSRAFFKGDARRYVRTTMLTRRLLGMNKLYVSWPVYAFTAEAIGQETMYPDRFPPGSDPDNMLINRDNFEQIALTKFDEGNPALLDEIIEFYTELTGMDPILHLSAPYSLAADTYGQEPLLGDLVHDRDFVVTLMDHLADNVHLPWAAHFFERFPNGWLEYSDASGSPFFIGPQNCKEIAIGAIKRIKDKMPGGFGQRMYDANYRGDYVTQAQKPSRGSGRRRGAQTKPKATEVDLKALTNAKHSICSDYVMRLHDDRVPVAFYADEARQQNVPLFAGIGASQIDKHSIVNFESEAAALHSETQSYVDAVKSVAATIRVNGYDNQRPPWPGMIYFEDVNSESSFELIEIIVAESLRDGTLEQAL